MRLRVAARWRRLTGLGVLLSAVLCPCHALTGGSLALFGLVGVAPVLTPGVQDGVHAVYLPTAVLVGARLLALKRWAARDAAAT